jgi:hypothetical protein
LVAAPEPPDVVVVSALPPEPLVDPPVPVAWDPPCPDSPASLSETTPPPHATEEERSNMKK